MTVNYAAIENAFGKLDVEITTRPGKGWFGSKYLEVSAKITAPNNTIETTEGRTLNVLYPGPSTVQTSVKLGITDEGFNTIKNTEKLKRLVLKTASEAYMMRFLDMPMPDEAISDDYTGWRTKVLEDGDQVGLRIHIDKSLENFADTLAKKLTETTSVTDIRPPSGQKEWFRDPEEGDYVNRYKAPVYAAAEHQLNKTMREKRERHFMTEKTTKYAHGPHQLGGTKT